EPDGVVVGSRPRPRSAAFICPPELRPRVDFWIDIFTRYGKNHAVIHHREYPQAVFAVLDFTREAEEMPAAELEKFRKRMVEATIARARGIIRELAAGAAPSSPAERRVADAMKLVPGRNRYGAILEDPDLIRSQTGIREKGAEAVERSGKYLPEMERIFVREFGLPVELTRLPFIESSFDYRAYSSVGAAGIWQFMPRTGRQFLTINRLVDERRDPLVSTYAAARYLQGGYEALGSWPLAVTAYNHGRAGVARKVREYGTTDIVRLIERPGDKPFGFASSNFYPELLAALDVFDDPHRYFPEVRIASPVEVTRVPLQAAMPISQVARKVNVSVDELREVNLALADAIWSGRVAVPKGYQVRVPRQGGVTVARLSEPEIGAPEQPAKTGGYAAAYHRVRKGETLTSIAKRYGTTAEQLASINSLNSLELRFGQQLVVAESGMTRQAAAPASTAPARIVYTIKSGDSLHSIAKRFGVSVAHIREVNRLESTTVKVGQTVVIQPSRTAANSKKH
ncbi:MAG: LysM peptidoglycan-binding domain-containing protein, partial [Proteobacteria bacterium]|nr:LysM peptidoglycan-binding domain-containing protein [Pseudomonadota bacterium]